MENISGLPERRSCRRVDSHTDFHPRILNTAIRRLSRPRSVRLSRYDPSRDTERIRINRSRSARLPRHDPENNTENSCDYLELLYKVTDVVLVICAVIIIVSCIATLGLFGYGCYKSDFSKFDPKLNMM